MKKNYLKLNLLWIKYVNDHTILIWKKKKKTLVAIK